jgi:hypothetical protein
LEDLEEVLFERDKIEDVLETAKVGKATKKFDREDKVAQEDD